MDSSERLEDSDRPGEDEPFVNPDVVKLYQRWRNEKYAPELLPFDLEVVENLAEVVEFVSETLEDERSQNPDLNDPHRVLRCVDLERLKYVLRDYLRIRLWKLGQWPQHYLEPANLVLLSDAERHYLRETWALKKDFFDHRLLGALPAAKKALDDQIDLWNMVRRPDLDKHVYARVLADVGEIEVPPTLTQESTVTPEPLRLEVGDTYLLKYSIVRKFFMEKMHEGKVELV